MNTVKSKIHGFYGVTEDKVSIFASTTFAKSYIPAPSKYESRGLSMSAILKKKAKICLYQPKLDFTRTTNKIAKTREPACTSYKVVEALNKSAQLRRSIDQTIPKAKNINYMSKYSFYCF